MRERNITPETAKKPEQAPEGNVNANQPQQAEPVPETAKRPEQTKPVQKAEPVKPSDRVKMKKSGIVRFVLEWKVAEFEANGFVKV